MRVITESFPALHSFLLKTPFRLLSLNSEPDTRRKCEKAAIPQCPGAKSLDTLRFLSENELTFCAHSIAAQLKPPPRIAAGTLPIGLTAVRMKCPWLVSQCGMPKKP